MYQIFKYVMHENGRHTRKEFKKLTPKAQKETLRFLGVSEASLNENLKLIESGTLFDVGWLAHCLVSTPEEIERLAMPALMEFMDVHAGGVTIFSEDSDLIEDIYKTKLDIDTLSESRWNVFSFAPQAGIEFDGTEIRPFIFVDAPLREIVESCSALFLKGAKLGELQFASKNERIIRVLIAGEDPYKWDGCWGGGCEEIIASLKKGGDSKRYLRVHMELALKLLHFAESFPDMIEQSFPKHMDRKAFDLSTTGHKKKTRKALMLRAPRDANGVREHLRSGCWVSWVHPKKCVRTGGRPWKSYRKGTTVKRKMTPYTIKKKGARGAQGA